MTQQEVKQMIDAWKKGDEKPFSRFYNKVYQKIMPQLKRLASSKQDAEDIFMEGLYVFFDKLQQKDDLSLSNINGYIYRICYNIWYDQKLKAKKVILVEETTFNSPDNLDYETPTTSQKEELQQKAWVRAIDKFSGICKKIFVAHIEEGRKLKDIWQEFGYKNYQSLVQANYKCKKRLTKLVIQELKQLQSQNKEY